jgi:hypothetical protein
MPARQESLLQLAEQAQAVEQSILWQALLLQTTVHGPPVQITALSQEWSLQSIRHCPAQLTLPWHEPPLHSITQLPLQTILPTQEPPSQAIVQEDAP